MLCLIEFNNEQDLKVFPYVIKGERDDMVVYMMMSDFAMIQLSCI